MSRAPAYVHGDVVEGHGYGIFVPAAGEHVGHVDGFEWCGHSVETGGSTNAGPNTDASGQCTIMFASSAAER